MELSFAQLYTQLAGAGEDVDLETVQKCMYTSSSLKQRNISLYDNIG